MYFAQDCIEGARNIEMVLRRTEIQFVPKTANYTIHALQSPPTRPVYGNYYYYYYYYYYYLTLSTKFPRV